jgi:hypothetical protein
VGFPTVRDTYPTGYMLGAAELGLAVLFFFGRKIQDAHALRLIIVTGATFHVASALAQLYAVVQGLAGNAVWANITLRTVLAGLLLRLRQAAGYVGGRVACSPIVMAT